MLRACQGLKRRFQHLDADGSGELEPPEFCNLLGNPPLGQALFKAMDGDNSGTLGFVELAKAVGLMRAAPAQRCRLFFRMVDQNVDGTVSLDELSSILAMLEPAVEQQGSEEQQFTLALYKALGDGHVRSMPCVHTPVPSRSSLTRMCSSWFVLLLSLLLGLSCATHTPVLFNRLRFGCCCLFLVVCLFCFWRQAEGFCRAVGAYSANKHFVEAFTNFLTKPHGIDLDKKHRDGDFSQGQMLFLTILMCIIGLMLTFTSVAPSQFSTTHLATALGRDDFKMCTLLPLSSFALVFLFLSGCFGFFVVFVLCVGVGVSSGCDSNQAAKMLTFRVLSLACGGGVTRHRPVARNDDGCSRHVVGPAAAVQEREVVTRGQLRAGGRRFPVYLPWLVTQLPRNGLADGGARADVDGR